MIADRLMEALVLVRTRDAGIHLGRVRFLGSGDGSGAGSGEAPA